MGQVPGMGQVVHLAYTVHPVIPHYLEQVLVERVVRVCIRGFCSSKERHRPVGLTGESLHQANAAIGYVAVQAGDAEHHRITAIGL